MCCSGRLSLPPGSGITTWKTRGKYSPSGGGGDAWGEVWFGSFLQRRMVFWWFLQTYMTSGPCSSWFFLVMKSWFFWCYLGLQAMAIHCRAAKNSLRGTLIFSKTRGDIRSSRFATGVNNTVGWWKKSSIRKFVMISFGHLWVVDWAYR